jgi:putative peptide zinc metalloprotease protein
MSAVYSSRWYRVAGLKPRLSTQLQLRRQRLRGQTWYLLAERGKGASVRLNAAAYAIAGRFDGRRSVQQLWDQLLASGDDQPTQDEVIELLAQLREAALVQFDRPADAERLLPHLDSVTKPRRRSSLLAWRIRLADPSALLDRVAPLQRLLFSRAAALIWALAVSMLLLLALQHATTLVAHGRQWLTTPRYATLAVLLYVPIKLLHELAHGVAVRRWGGAVREAGITLMLGLPVPWVDASAATAFVRRRQRVIVGAAGMMAELALAAVALPLWLTLPDGLLRDAMFVIMFIAGVSTLLFNANPLQRLDGYYIATDLLALPNLAPRSRQWWLDLLQRRVLRVPAAEPMALARGETAWLAAYAPLAWLYMLAIAVFAVQWLGQISLVLGVVAGVLLAWQMGLRPLVTLLTALRTTALAQQATAQRWHRIVLAGSALLIVLLLVPLPQRTRVQGVVWPPDDAQLRVEEDGFVADLHVADGALVQPGDVVLELANPALRTRLERQSARVSALEAELVQALPGGANGPNAPGGEGRAGDAQAELASAQAELDRLREREAALTVRAQVGGRIALPQAADLPGSYLHRGSLFGQVLAGAPPTVRVALPESDAGDLKRELRAVSVRLATSPWHEHPARLVRDGAGAGLQLPSAALSQRHGGPVATDPLDKQDLKPLQPVVLLDLQLTTDAGTTARLGERVWVRFDAGYSPSAWQIARGLQRELLRRFSPQL